MSLFVDTSTWSLALRRDTHQMARSVGRLREALVGSEPLFTTGLVLQELLQGFDGAKAHDAIKERFSALPLVVPDREDHVGAAEVRNTCRRSGVQIGTVDALLIQLCMRHDLTLLAEDRDFDHAARHVRFKRWE